MFEISCRENPKHFLCHSNFLKNHAVNEIILRNIVETDRPWMTVWNMCIACWITKATNTCSEYVILLFYSNNG
jgi:hypothetical protein